MRTKQRSGNNRRLRKHTALTLAAILCLCGIMFGCRNRSAATASTAKAEDPATHDLRAIGDKVTAAVIGKDINTLLQYDHDPEDQASLRNKSGELYCYLFDSICIPHAKTRAVYDVLTATPQLAVDASTTRVNGNLYGLLMFYDKSKISSTQLYSPDFLCSDQAIKQTASWHFVQVNGKWTSSTLFDYKMDRSCKQ